MSSSNMTTEPLKLLSPAKLNLFLHINGRRADGYHELQTLFQLLNYGDELRFTLRSNSEIHITPAIDGLPREQNLIYKAAKLLQSHIGTNLGADIHLTKILPMGGGIGGGSSNAATALIGLNHLWGLALKRAELQQLGLQLGADVPVFVFGQTAFAEGVGERLQAIEMPQNWFLVVQPDCHVSTKEIFSNKCLTRDTPRIKVAAFPERGSKNDCQALVRELYPPVDEALKWFENRDYNARMTGTGACVFAQFTTAEEAQQVLQCLPKHLPGFVAQGINQSPYYKLVADV